MNKTLMILALIVAVLLWKFVLFPEKLDFTDKVKVLQGLYMARPYKKAVIEYWEEKKTLPTAEQWRSDGTEVNVDLGTSIISAIKIAEIAPGSITVFYSNAQDPSIDPEISGKTLSLTPHERAGLIEWSCKGTVPVVYLPAACR